MWNQCMITTLYLLQFDSTVIKSDPDAKYLQKLDFLNYMLFSLLEFQTHCKKLFQICKIKTRGKNLIKSNH